MLAFAGAEVVGAVSVIGDLPFLWSRLSEPVNTLETAFALSKRSVISKKLFDPPEKKRYGLAFRHGSIGRDRRRLIMVGGGLVEAASAILGTPAFGAEFVVCHF
jgi:hypothetical protein